MGLFGLLKKKPVNCATAHQSDHLVCQASQQIILQARSLQTDLIIMDAHGAACPECAKYQGRVFSISGESNLFPKAPEEFFELGSIHAGCSHNFWPYIHGVNDPDLKYTLSVHPLINKQYGKNIVIFSNRPFVDDRTDSAKKQYQQHKESLDRQVAEAQRQKEQWEQYEIRRKEDIADYEWLSANYPDKCPKSFTGYRRMKTQNTKNFQLLREMAAELGRKI